MTESSRLYVEDKLAERDPDFLLTRIFAPAQQRRALSALHALRAELRAIPLEVSDPGVALAKLGWWQQEWERLMAGQARHPVTLEFAYAGVAAPPLAAALAGPAALIESPSVESVAQVERLIRALAEPLAELEGSLSGGEAPLEDWVRIQWIGLLEDLGALASAGRAPVPLELLASCQLSRDGLAADAAALGRVVEALAAGLAAPAGRPSGHAGIYRAVQELKLTRYRRGERSPPGGVRRLWAAWRGAHAVRRGT